MTCTTTMDRVAQDDMAFQSILASFGAPQVEGARFDWKAIGSSGMTGGIVGGITAGIAAVVIQARKKKQTGADPKEAKTQ